MVELLKIMVISFKRSDAVTAALSAPNLATGHHRPTPPPETPGHSQAVWVSLLWGHCSFLLCPVCTRFCWCHPRVYFPVLCNDRVNGNLLQEYLCHSQVCCTQSPCLCGSPPLTRTSTGDAQTQFCLCLCGVPGFWLCTRFV